MNYFLFYNADERKKKEDNCLTMIKINRIRKKVSQFRWSLYSSLITYATEAYPGEATRSFTTPPWLGYQSMAILLPPFLLGFPDNKPFLELLPIFDTLKF